MVVMNLALAILEREIVYNSNFQSVAYCVNDEIFHVFFIYIISFQSQ